MAQRMSIREIAPDAYKAAMGLQKYVNAGTLGLRLIALVDIRTSQINKCAWCLNTRPRSGGDPRESAPSGLDRRLGRSRELFQRKRAGGACQPLTEQVTLISEQGVTDEVRDRVPDAFTRDEVVHLLMAISAINVWNRMNVTARTAVPGEGA